MICLPLGERKEPSDGNATESLLPVVGIHSIALSLSGVRRESPGCLISAAESRETFVMISLSPVKLLVQILEETTIFSQFLALLTGNFVPFVAPQLFLSFQWYQP